MTTIRGSLIEGVKTLWKSCCFCIPSLLTVFAAAYFEGTMLSGIRKGKKKRPKPEEERNNAKATSDENQLIADKLRQSLFTGDVTSSGEHASCSVLDGLERRGRISSNSAAATETSRDDTIVIMNPIISAATLKREEDMSIQELVALERKDQGMSLDEQMTRTLARVGKKRRRKIGQNEDSDEEIERMKKLLPSQDSAAIKPKAVAKAHQREVHRQVAQHYQHEKITSKCPWWIESSSFTQSRLLALGDHVSLVMAPPNASLQLGHHFYLVPIKHAESFVACDDDGVWDEVRRFQTSLQNMYAKEKKAIILLETVLPNNSFWQTKMELIPTPFPVIQDAPIYFKSAMLEQTEEWGTHSKILSTTLQKPLRSVVPKKFPYFYVEWGSVSTSDNTGYAQIIESSNFRHDFGLDTLAGMMELDPIRFQRKKKFAFQEEREYIANFLTKWKEFDWTLQLDAAA